MDPTPQKTMTMIFIKGQLRVALLKGLQKETRSGWSLQTFLITKINLE